MQFIYAVSILLAVAFYAALFSGVVWIFQKTRRRRSTDFAKQPILDTRRAGAVLAAALFAALATFGPASCGSPHSPIVDSAAIL